MPIDSIKQLLAWRPPFIGNAFISEGILLPETRMMMFGAFGSWKSVWSIHTAFAIAGGTPWFGYRTRKATVFKYQAELPKFMDKERVESYVRATKLYPENVFFKTAQDRVKLDTTWGVQSLTRDIEEVKLRSPDAPLVVLLDPLYAMMAGHISEEYDVKKFQDNMNEAIFKYHFTLIVVHHPRKTKVEEGMVLDMGGEEIMGSSYWSNWFDTILRAKVTNPYAGADTVEYRFEKTRNAKKFLPPFLIQWNRNTLVPTLLKQGELEVAEPSIKGLKEYRQDD